MLTVVGVSVLDNTDGYDRCFMYYECQTGENKLRPQYQYT